MDARHHNKYNKKRVFFNRPATLCPITGGRLPLVWNVAWDPMPLFQEAAYAGLPNKVLPFGGEGRMRTVYCPGVRPKPDILAIHMFIPLCPFWFHYSHKLSQHSHMDTHFLTAQSQFSCYDVITERKNADAERSYDDE